jgi:hypothetical protein
MFETNNNPTPSLDKKIEAELRQGLLNAEEPITDQGTPGAINSGVLSKSRSGFLDKFIAEQFCDIKNNFISSRLSEGLNTDGKAMVKEVYTATPEEVEAYLNLIEFGCSSLMPPEWLDAMEGFFKHPAAAALKIEVMKYRMLSKKLDAFRVPVEPKKEESAA